MTKSHVAAIGRLIVRVRDDGATRLIARIPIYTPGTLSRISEASAFARQRGYEVQDNELRTLANARSAYRRRRTTAADVASAAVRVESLRATVKGMGIERSAGFRTILGHVGTLNAL